jgi:hypothetical protein
MCTSNICVISGICQLHTYEKITLMITLTIITVLFRRCYPEEGVLGGLFKPTTIDFPAAFRKQSKTAVNYTSLFPEIDNAITGWINGQLASTVAACETNYQQAYRNASDITSMLNTLLKLDVLNTGRGDIVQLFVDNDTAAAARALENSIIHLAADLQFVKSQFTAPTINTVGNSHFVSVRKTRRAGPKSMFFYTYNFICICAFDT